MTSETVLQSRIRECARSTQLLPVKVMEQVIGEGAAAVPLVIAELEMCLAQPP